MGQVRCAILPTKTSQWIGDFLSFCPSHLHKLGERVLFFIFHYGCYLVIGGPPVNCPNPARSEFPQCYDPDMLHFLFPTWLITLHVPEPPWLILTQNSWLTTYESFHMTSSLTSLWRTLTHAYSLPTSSWLIPRIRILGSHHMFVQHKHLVTVYKP